MHTDTYADDSETLTMTCSSKRHGSAVSRRRLLWFTPDWEALVARESAKRLAALAAASRVCGKFGDAVLRPLWPAADAY